MTNASKYFKKEPDRTLEELEKELTVKEIQSIIYSLEIEIRKEADGKIHFEYLPMGPLLKTKIKIKRKLNGLPDDYVMVYVFECYVGNNKPCYGHSTIDEIPELSKYLKSK